MNFTTLLTQQGPAETTQYMIAGFVVIFGAMGLYILSLYIRQRNLRLENQLLEEIETDHPVSRSE